MPERIVVVGLEGERPQWAGAQATLARADLVVGGRRHLEAVADSVTETVTFSGDLKGTLEVIASEPGTVCVLASGDPGFFGIVRALSARFGPERLEVHPAISSVATAFARIGLPWDDALVVSAHGRPLTAATRLAASARKAAVLVSPDNPPEALGQALVAAGARGRQVHVCSRLGCEDETVVATDLEGLAAGCFDPLSVVILIDDNPKAPQPSLAWGLQDDRFSHQGGMITKAEVRAVVLSKLALPPSGVMWDVGAGSASVAIEAARLTPSLRVHAVEADPARAGQARANVVAHGVDVSVLEGSAPGVLAGLEDPDRAFVGGGGLGVLDAVLARLCPGGRLVATYAAMDRAAAAWSRLGNLVQLGVARGEALADGGLRLAAHNPVFVVWGPTP